MTILDPRTHRAAARRRGGRLAGTVTAACLTLTGLTAVSAQAADTGSITGEVFTQAVGGSAVPASSVYIYLSYSPTIDGSYDSVDTDPSTPGTNGYSFDGNTFTLSALKAGYYKFEVADVGDSTYQREYYNDAEYLSAATPVHVGTGVTHVANMTLEPAGHISGVVRDAAGEPLANASVSFQQTEFGSSFAVTTDSQGRYTTASGTDHGLVAGTYRAVADGPWSTETDPDAPDYESEYWKEASTYAAATAVTVAPGQTKTGVDFSLEVAPRIRLTVKDPAGQPLKNANVGIWYFYDGAWGPYQAGPNVTDANGVYRKTVSVGERYKFFINPPAGVDGVMEWYDNAYSEATATEVSATTVGQVRDITIQLGAAPTTPAPTPTSPAPAVPVAPKTLKTSKVSITGTPRVGKTLRARTRPWGPSPVALSYTWYRDGKTVKGQVKSTYKLRNADKGKRISVRVHQRKASYVTANRLSGKTSKIRKR
jgi:hypothetical protein